MAEQDRIRIDGLAPEPAQSAADSMGAPAGAGPSGSGSEPAPADAWAAPGYASAGAAPGWTGAPGSFGGLFPPGANDFAILSLVIAVGGMVTGMGMATSPVSIVLGFMGLSTTRY